MMGKLSRWLALALACASAQAADMWFSPTANGVTTNNDCGVVAALRGGPRVRRANRLSTAAADEDLSLSDKIHAGDEILTGPEGLVEVASGKNVIILAGPNTALRFLGLRLFEQQAAKKSSRLDAELVAGSVRMQVRLNTASPEAVLLNAPAMASLLERGDCAAVLAASWRLTVLEGGAECRLGGTDVPVEVGAGRTLAADGAPALAAESIAEIKTRLPFAYEIRRAALPPNPLPDPGADAP
ncbi:MAG: hypothetical protein LBT97_08530 [Planctomycetota bacterium]|jgi:hypothetical protein|nr:hypothetical protein [Planctomycetota bacterium]